VWKRLSEVQDIRRIVELLGASEGESVLKKSIINALLLERSAAAAASASAGECCVCLRLCLFYVRGVWCVW